MLTSTSVVVHKSSPLETAIALTVVAIGVLHDFVIEVKLEDAGEEVGVGVGVGFPFFLPGWATSLVDFVLSVNLWSPAISSKFAVR